MFFECDINTDLAQYFAFDQSCASFKLNKSDSRHSTLFTDWSENFVTIYMNTIKINESVGVNYGIVRELMKRGV